MISIENYTFLSHFPIQSTLFFLPSIFYIQIHSWFIIHSFVKEYISETLVSYKIQVPYCCDIEIENVLQKFDIKQNFCITEEYHCDFEYKIFVKSYGRWLLNILCMDTWFFLVFIISEKRSYNKMVCSVHPHTSNNGTFTALYTY